MAKLKVFVSRHTDDEFVSVDYQDEHPGAFAAEEILTAVTDAVDAARKVRSDG